MHEQNHRFVRLTISGYVLVMAISIAGIGSIFAFVLIGAWAMRREQSKRRELTQFVLMVMH